MILLKAAQTATINDLKKTLQRAIPLEFATLPPYLYTMYTVSDNPNARKIIPEVAHEGMIHMMLACDILNALGGEPLIADTKVVPTYPNPLRCSIGSETGDSFIVSLIPLLQGGDEAGHQNRGTGKPLGNQVEDPVSALQKVIAAGRSAIPGRCLSMASGSRYSKTLRKMAPD